MNRNAAKLRIQWMIAAVACVLAAGVASRGENPPGDPPVTGNTSPAADKTPPAESAADKPETAVAAAAQPPLALEYVLREPQPIVISRLSDGGNPADTQVGPFTLNTLGSVYIADGIRVGGSYLGLNPNVQAPLGAPRLSDFVSSSGSGIERGSLVDVFGMTGAVEIYRYGALKVNALAGVQGVSIDQTSRADATPPLTLTPLAGAGAEIDLGSGLLLGGRAMAGPRLGSAGDGSGDSNDVALSVSSRWIVSPSVSFEMEYQYSRIAAEADQFSGQLRHQGVVVQFKLSF